MSRPTAPLRIPRSGVLARVELAYLQVLADRFALKFGDTPQVTAERRAVLRLALEPAQQQGRYTPRHAAPPPHAEAFADAA